jgi:hypothetical protein
MNDYPVVKGRIHIGFFVLILLGGFGMGILGFCFTPWDVFTGDNGDDIGAVLFGLFWWFFSFFAFYALFFEWKKLEVYNDRLEIRPLIGKGKQFIYFDDILTYDTEEIEGEYDYSIHHMLYTPKMRFGFSSSHYSNYKEIWAAIISGKEKDDGKQAESPFSESNLSGVLTIATGILLILAGIWLTSINRRALRPDELKQIKDFVISPIAIDHNNKSNPKLVMELQYYPDLAFEIAGKRLQQTDTDRLIREVILWDTLTLLVEKEVYELGSSRLKNSDEPHNDLVSIPVYALAGKKNKYLSISRNQPERVVGNGGLWAFVIVGGIVFVIGLFFMLARGKG